MTNPNDPSGTTPPQWSAPSETPAGSPNQGPAAASPVGAPPTPVFVPPAPPPAQAVPVSPVTSIARPARKRGAIDIVLVVAAVFAVGGIGFAVGRVTAPAATVAVGAGTFRTGTGNGQFGTGQGGNGGGQFGNGGGFFGGGAGAGITISGEVTEVTVDHLTLKLASGQTVEIPVDSSTAYHSQAPATATDVTTGSTVQVQVSPGRRERRPERLARHGGGGAGFGSGPRRA